jgi:uncharacterized protein YprB with RNaseH-like and TPR domain
MVTLFDIETLGLDAFQHQIVLIGMKIEGKIKQWKLWKEKDELSMIFKCLKTLEKIPLRETIVGYNNLKFDVPFISTRLSVHGKWSRDLWELLYRDRKWFDLYQFLGNDFRRMSSWLDKLGIKRKHEDIMGRDIPILYAKKKYRKIVQHNKDDLETSEKLYLKLREEFPELLRI